ncbi:MAG: ATP-binding protein [Gemmatimonadaceae bacterium]
MVALGAAARRGGPADGMRVRIEVEVPSDVRYIEKIVDLVARQCATLSFSPRQCSLNVPVALSEALSNAILRGNREDPAKHVRVRAALDEVELVVEVADEGSGFDLDNQHDPTSPEHLEDEDGRGIFLMKRLMDSVERFTDGGNVVRLVLRRT